MALASFLAVLGPDTGILVLQALLPGIPRAAIEEYVREYRRRMTEGSGRVVHALRWHVPGTVYAMDFSYSPVGPIDGEFPYFLAVRDLASGKSLGAPPTPDQCAKTVQDRLVSLFVEHGAPLVLKSDNGSGFIDEGTRDFLRRRGVELLLSPPGTPSFNGSCEAGIGSLKLRTHYIAARNDHPERWTADDLEAARVQANQTARPFGPDGPTAEEFWASRPPVDETFRRTFGDTVRILEGEVRQLEGRLPGLPLERKVQDQVDRAAITKALLYHVLLTIKRRRLTPEIRAAKRVNIT